MNVVTRKFESENNGNFAFDIPPQRIFLELSRITQYQKRNRGMLEEELKISKQDIVETVGKYRKGFLGKEKFILSRSGVIKKDNVSTEEVVAIINEQRKEEKLIRTPYKKFVYTSEVKLMSYKDQLKKVMSLKVDELRKIFEQEDKEMEWNQIVKSTVEKIMEGFE